jgi:hypothetical protein
MPVNILGNQFPKVLSFSQHTALYVFIQNEILSKRILVVGR